MTRSATLILRAALFGAAAWGMTRLDLWGRIWLVGLAYAAWRGLSFRWLFRALARR